MGIVCQWTIFFVNNGAERLRNEEEHDLEQLKTIVRNFWLHNINKLELRHKNKLGLRYKNILGLRYKNILGLRLWYRLWLRYRNKLGLQQRNILGLWQRNILGLRHWKRLGPWHQTATFSVDS